MNAKEKATAANEIAKLTIKQLVRKFEATYKITSVDVSDLMVLLLKELKNRDSKAFFAWLEDKDSAGNIRKFFIKGA